MEEMYKQCLMKCEDVTTSSWIEEKYAKVGLTGKFKDVGDGRRWEILEVSKESLPKSQIDHQAERFIKHQHPTNTMRGNK